MATADTWDVAIVGGGGAGLMAAWWSARAGARTILLEGSRACGLKVLISGGGRCNLLPAEADESDFYTSGSRNVLRRFFRTWRLAAVREFFECEFGIPLELEEESSKLFPVWQRARPVRDRMVERVLGAGVELRVPWRVAALRREGGAFVLERAAGGGEGEALRAERVVLATGGCSVPKTGSDGAGLELARRLGHSLLQVYPALVPLTSADEELRELAGVALPVTWRVRRGKAVVEERTRELLFTHRGFSGPAVLDASHWWVREGAPIEVAWGGRTPEDWEEHWRGTGRRECARALGDYLPRRLAPILCRRVGLRPEVRVGNLNRQDRDRLLGVLCSFALPVNGHEGFRVAEVTGGGIPLEEVDPSTLESRRQPGLYLCGEMLDVIGRIGGFNFLWAWVTGRLAGECAARARERSS